MSNGNLDVRILREFLERYKRATENCEREKPKGRHRHRHRKGHCYGRCHHGMK